MAGKSYVMKIEVDLDVYNELQAICALHGTTIESATEAFIRFSADPRNIGVLTKYLYAMERIYDIGLSHHLHIQKCTLNRMLLPFCASSRCACQGCSEINPDGVKISSVASG